MNFKSKAISACIAALFSLTMMTPVVADPPAKVSSGVMMQGFGWDSKAGGDKGNWFRNLEGKADDMKSLGIDFLWFPPVTRSVSDQGYLPCEWYDVGTPSNPTFLW
jgi:alpha-amylase